MCKIVVVIPTHNRKQHLYRVLEDIAAQDCDGIELQTVVVVDGSTDGTQAMLREDFPRVISVHGPGDWWYTRSMNEGFAEAYGLAPDYILTMNDDVRLPSNYVQELHEAMQKFNKPTIMGSISVTVEEPHRITFSGIKDIRWWRYKYVPHMPHYSRVHLDGLRGIRDSKVLPGRGMLIPTRVLKALDGFDPDLVQYGSDDDFCLRAAKHEVKVKVSYSAVVHSYDKLTGMGNPSRRNSLTDVIKSFNNRYSTLYLPKSIQAIRRHGNRFLMPLTVLIIIIGSIRANLRSQKA